MGKTRPRQTVACCRAAGCCPAGFACEWLQSYNTDMQNGSSVQSLWKSSFPHRPTLSFVNVSLFLPNEDRPLVAVCSVHKSCFPHVSKRDMDQIKVQVMWAFVQLFILLIRFHSSLIGVKTQWNVVIDSWDWFTIGRVAWPMGDLPLQWRDTLFIFINSLWCAWFITPRFNQVYTALLIVGLVKRKKIWFPE